MDLKPGMFFIADVNGIPRLHLRIDSVNYNGIPCYCIRVDNGRVMGILDGELCFPLNDFLIKSGALMLTVPLDSLQSRAM